MMRYFSKLVSFFLSLALSSAAFSQSTLGDLQMGGAAKVTKDAWKALLPATFAGLDFTGRVNFSFEFKDNGKFSGYATSTSGNGSSGSFGTWTMDENGKQCIDERLPTWRMSWDECYFVFKQDDRYFAVQSDSDPSSKALIRSITQTK